MRSSPSFRPRTARVFRWASVILFGCWLSWVSAAELASNSSGTVFADSLKPNATRLAGKTLSKSEIAGSSEKWSANKEITIGEKGATTTVPSTAAVSFPVTAGNIRVSAEICPQGTGFTGLVIGRSGLTGVFWQNLSVMFFVSGDGRYNLFAAGKTLIETPEKGVVVADGPNQTEMVLDTVARTVTLRLNGKTVLENAALPKEVALETITAAGFHFQEPVKAGQPFVRDFRLERTSLTAAGLEPVDYAQTFVVPGRETTLRWQASDPGPKKEIPYEVAGYWNEALGHGLAVRADDGTFSFTRTFSRGYSEIRFPESGQTFGIVSLEPSARPPDPFFCMDAGLTWLEQNPARREGLVRIMARSGIAQVRERFDAPFGATPGNYNWEGGRKVDSMRKTYAENKVPILEILGSSKAMFGMVPGQVFPQNLPVFATEWSEVARHFEHVWGGAEVYNESDLRAAPADQYVPMAKALSYSLAQAKSKVPLVAGTFATAPPGPYFDTCAANGLLADADAVSFHAYDKATDIGQLIGRYRDWLKKSNVEALPLWLTECGKPWKLGPGRPLQEEDALSACEISTMGMEAMAGGVARYFPFVFVYYEEGLKNFGMMGREATPLRSMAGYAQSITALSGKQYLGDLQGIGTPVKLARVFGAASGGERVAVLYTGKIDRQAAVAFPLAVQRLAGADGRELALAEGKVPIPDGLTYVWLKDSDLSSSLVADAATARLYQLGKNPLQPKRLTSPIVLQLLPQDLPARTSARRYLVTSETAQALPIHVRLHNLSSAPLEVTPELTLPGGSADQKATVTIPALSFTDVAWQVDATKALDLAQTRFVTITAKSNGDVQPSPLAIPLAMEGNLEQHLATHKSKTPLPITDLTKWKSNSAPAKVGFSVTPEGFWRMDISFSGKQGNWTYPRFTLPGPLNPAVDYGFLIRARVVTLGRPAIIAKSGEGPGSGVSFWVPDIFPGDGEWHVAYIPFAEFKPGPGSVGNQNTRLDPASWKMIEIGMGSQAQENALEISHFVVVGGPGGE